MKIILIEFIISIFKALFDIIRVFEINTKIDNNESRTLVINKNLSNLAKSQNVFLNKSNHIVSRSRFLLIIQD